MNLALASLPTPCALVDRDRLERNLAAMAARATRLGVRLRPHVKTHKCIEIAQLQAASACFGGITVSSLAEARHFAEAGFEDILWAVPVSLARMAEAAELASRIPHFAVILDDPQTAEALERAAQARGVRMRALVEIDTGHRRTGLPAERFEAIATLAARLQRSAHVAFGGILTHAGQSYSCRSRVELAAVARAERDAMVALAGRLRAQGLPVESVSIGSTPAMAVAEDLTGITEVRPGNYAYFDAFQAAIGACVVDDIAFSVLASVIGCYPDQGRAVLDAGALALSKDPGPTHVDAACGFGLLATVDGEPLPGLRLEGLSQEHGVLRAAPGFDFARIPVGTRLRILPNHSCLAAALFDEVLAVRSGEVEARWRPVRGW